MYCKDKNWIYIIWDNFKNIEWVDIDKSIVYWKHFSIYNNQCYYHWEIIEWIDMKTFKILSNNFALDKNGVYYDWKLIEIDKYIGSPINPFTFKIINKYFVKDDKWIYITENNFERIDWADPESFEIINDYYQKDKSNVYYDWKIVCSNSKFNSIYIIFFKIINIYKNVHKTWKKIWRLFWKRAEKGKK